MSGKPKQFRVEIVTGSLLSEDRTLPDAIEEAYERLNDSALADDMVIVRQDQFPVSFDQTKLAMIIIAQRVSRATLREMEMRSQIGQTVPPIKPVRSS